MTTKGLDDLQKSAMDYFYGHLDGLTRDEKDVIANLPKKGVEWLGLMQHYGRPNNPA